MAANYLVRKGDTYYFRHCVPTAAQLGHKNENMSYDRYGSKDIHLDVKYKNIVTYFNYEGCKLPWNNEEYFQTEKISVGDMIFSVSNVQDWLKFYFSTQTYVDLVEFKN